MATALIIDDDMIMCDMLSEMIEDLGHDAEASQSLKDGLKLVSSKAFDIVFLDVKMPDGNGLDIISKVKEAPSLPEIIIITGLGDENGAELAINSGAWDYIEKASSIKDIRLSFIKALQYRKQKEKSRIPVVLQRAGIIGNSQTIRVCLDQVAQAAHSNANVLIAGETGTGKELFTEAIHLNSSRSARDLVVIDCAALPDSIVENILFGHKKGAFTGADSSSAGLISQADGGTLFLDEVGELPLSVQKTFLRVLQERRFRPIGGKREIKSDFRLISATNIDLAERVRKGKFREDLLYRLQTITIFLPPLRERREDTREIARFHMAKICKFLGFTEKVFSDNFLKILETYQWPGNVRELINTIEQTVSEANNEPVLFGRHLPNHLRIQAACQKIKKKSHPDCFGAESSRFEGQLPAMRDFLDTMRAEYLKKLMSGADGKVKKACRISGLSRARLYQLMKQYGLSIAA